MVAAVEFRCIWFKAVDRINWVMSKTITDAPATIYIVLMKLSFPCQLQAPQTDSSTTSVVVNV